MQASGFVRELLPKFEIATIQNYFKIRHKLNDEYRIVHLAKEALIVFVKTLKAGAYTSLAAYLIVAYPPVTAFAVSGVAFAYFHKSIASYLAKYVPQRTADFVKNYGMYVGGFAVISGMAYILQCSVTPVAMGIGIGFVANKIQNFIHPVKEHVVIGRNLFSSGVTLTQESIIKDLETLAKDKRHVEHLELHHGGNYEDGGINMYGAHALSLNQEVIDSIIALTPKKISLKNVILPDEVLNKLNQKLTAQYQNDEDSRVAFYYFDRASNQYLLKTADCEAKIPTFVELTIEEKRGEYTYGEYTYNETMFAAFQHVRLSHDYPLTVRFKAKALTQVDGKSPISLSDLQNALETNPTSIAFDKGTNVEVEGRIFLRTPQYDEIKEQYYYYKTIDTWLVQKTFLADDCRYTIYYGTASPEEPVVDCLQKLRDAKVQVGTLEISMTEGYELTDQMLQLIANIAPKKILGPLPQEAILTLNSKMEGNYYSPRYEWSDGDNKHNSFDKKTYAEGYEIYKSTDLAKSLEDVKHFSENKELQKLIICNRSVEVVGENIAILLKEIVGVKPMTVEITNGTIKWDFFEALPAGYKLEIDTAGKIIISFNSSENEEEK